MSDATSTFTVRARADVDDAVRGLGRVEDAADKAGNEAATLGSQFRDMTGAVLTAEAAMALFGAAAQFASESVGKAIAADEALSSAATVTTERVDGLKVAFGNLIVGGEDGATAIWGLNDILLDLTETLADTGIEGGIALTAVNLLRDGLIGITYIVDGAIIAWAGLKTGIEAVTAVVFAAGQGVVGLSTALADLAQVFVGGAIEGFANLLDGAISLAETLGAGGLLPDGARESAAWLRQLGVSVADGADPMARLNEASVQIAGTFDQLRDSTAETRESMIGALTVTTDLRSALRDTREQTAEYTRTVQGAAEAVEAWAFSEQEAIDALFGRRTVIDPKMQESIFGTKAADDLSALVAAATEAKSKIAAALYVDPETGFGLSVALSKEYDAAREAMTMLGTAADSLGTALADGLGAALSAQENFGKAFTAAIGQSLVSSGIQTILEGLKALIPIPGLFNPAAAAVAGATGSAMVLAGKAMGGKGSAPSGGGGGGGRSVGESSGLSPVPTQRMDAPVTLTDFTGVTIVTNDVDSMRAFTDRQSRTAETGGTARV